MNLNKKSALITGGSEGLGFAIAEKLLEKGMNVAICGRDQEKLIKAKKSLSSSQLTTLPCDVSNYPAVAKMVNEIGGVDILINNAGIWAEGRLEEHSPEIISQILSVNLLGTIFVTRAVLPLMKERNQGFILNISSTSGIRAKPNHSVYVASKYGVSGFTESLMNELQGTDIKVACLYPGGMNTKLFAKAGSVKDVSQWMDPKKVAETIVFMLESDETMVLSQVVLDRRSG